VRPPLRRTEHGVGDHPFDPTAPLVATGNLRRRQFVSLLASGGARASAYAAVLVLAIVVYEVVKRGGGSLSFDFITKPPPLFGGTGGGIAPEIVGTIIIVTLATLIAVPIGVLSALFVTEFAGARGARLIKTMLDLMQGLPTVIVGVLIFGLLVAGSGQSGLAASLALAIIMLPLISRAAQEVIRLVPTPLREASQALGMNRWRTITGVVLPYARRGIVTGTILSIARASGETAPLIFLSSIFNPTQFSLNPFAGNHAIPNIPVEIFTLSEQGDPASVSRAWGAALVLLIMILLLNFVARARLPRRRGAGP
jgi:phosphate transport system permease protein